MIWLSDVFDKHTRSRTIGQYRLLILDGHGSHATAEFDSYCTKHLIIPLYMPPHSSHLLQPLDVGCFSSLKRAYGRRVDELIRYGTNQNGKTEFLAIYQQVRTEAISTKNIHDSFLATGLVTLNPDEVLTRFQVQFRTPTPPLLTHQRGLGCLKHRIILRNYRSNTYRLKIYYRDIHSRLPR